MKALIEKAVERLGKKKVWLIVHTLRNLQAVDRTVAGVREALRRIQLYLDDEYFAELTARFSLCSDEKKRDDTESLAFDTDAFVRAFLATLPPRRQHVVNLVLRRVDPALTGFITFDQLMAAYDVLRHPFVLTRLEPKELQDEFLSDFAEAADAGNGITADELVAYYIGISHTMPCDRDFELRCIRSFSLDRPKCTIDEGVSFSEDIAMRRSRASGLGDNKLHPLYQTTSSEYGKGCEKMQYNGKFSRNHCFTKYAPAQRSGGVTSMNM